MSSELFSLCGTNFQSSLPAALYNMQQCAELVDVTLVCDDGQVKAHKLILSANSSLFRQIFQDNHCLHSMVILPDVHVSVLRGLLTFLYTGEVHILWSSLSAFMHTAEQLGISGLTGIKCSDQIVPMGDQAALLSSYLVSGVVSPELELSPVAWMAGRSASEPPHMCTMQLGHALCSLEIDTGSCVNLVSLDLLR